MHLPTRTNIFRAINLPYHILSFLFGKEHPLWARLLLGFLLMFASCFIEPHPTVMDAVRGMVHAIGMVPLLDALIEWHDRHCSKP